MAFASSIPRILSRLYDTFTVHPLTFTSPYDGTPVSMQAIDRTKGIEIAEQKNFIPSIRPVATVLASDLAARNIAARAMEGVTVSLNGASWRVKTTESKPGPAGEAGGEVYLVLVGRDDA